MCARIPTLLPKAASAAPALPDESSTNSRTRELLRRPEQERRAAVLEGARRRPELELRPEATGDIDAHERRVALAQRDRLPRQARACGGRRIVVLDAKQTAALAAVQLQRRLGGRVAAQAAESVRGHACCAKNVRMSASSSSGSSIAGEVAAGGELGPVHDIEHALAPAARRQRRAADQPHDPGRRAHPLTGAQRHLTADFRFDRRRRAPRLVVDAHRGVDRLAEPVDRDRREQLVDCEAPQHISAARSFLRRHAVAEHPPLVDQPRRQPGGRVGEAIRERLEARAVDRAVRRVVAHVRRLLIAEEAPLLLGLRPRLSRLAARAARR